MAGMKVYGGVFDGMNRLIVAAKTKREAHRALESATRGRLSYYSFSQFASETRNPVEISFASSSPGVVFSKSATRWNDTFRALNGDKTDAARSRV